MYHELEELLTSVNEVAQASTIEDLRESVTNNVMEVYRLVGAAGLWDGNVEHYELKEGVKSLPRPTYCIRPLQLVFGRLDVESFTPEGQFVGDQGQIWGFSEQGRVLMMHGGRYVQHLQTGFSNLYWGIPGWVTLSYWSIPLGDNGAPLIDDRIWSAVRHFCRASEATNKVIANPRMTVYLGIADREEQKASRAIDFARGQINASTPNTNRTFFRGLRLNHPG
jgi:hypothetical protein